MAALATPTKPCETKDEARAHLVTLKGSQIAWPKGRKDVKLVIASMPAFEAVSRNTHGHPRWSIKVENYGQPCVEGLDERNIVMRSDKGAEMKVFGVNHVTWTDSKMYIWPVDGEQNPYDDAMRTEFESKFPVGTSVTFHTVTRTEHALQNSWSIWEHRKVTAARQEQAEAWDASVFRVCDFATVEGFWRYFHAIPPPGKIFFNGQFKPELRGRNVEAFSVFKAGVKPSWESSANKGLLYVKQSFNVRQINSCWESIVLACIGEVLDEKHSGIVCGCKVADKHRANSKNTSFKIEVYINNNDEASPEVVAVRKAMSELLEKAMTAGPGLARTGEDRSMGLKVEFRDISVL